MFCPARTIGRIVLQTQSRRWRACAQLLLLALLATSGCATHRSLAKHTIATNMTVADMYHQQVMDNLALFVHNPAAMPSFSVVTAGTVNVSDQAGASVRSDANATWREGPEQNSRYRFAEGSVRQANHPSAGSTRTATN